MVPSFNLTTTTQSLKTNIVRSWPPRIAPTLLASVPSARKSWISPLRPQWWLDMLQSQCITAMVTFTTDQVLTARSYVSGILYYVKCLYWNRYAIYHLTSSSEVISPRSHCSLTTINTKATYSPTLQRPPWWKRPQILRVSSHMQRHRSSTAFTSFTLQATSTRPCSRGSKSSVVCTVCINERSDCSHTSRFHY